MRAKTLAAVAAILVAVPAFALVLPNGACGCVPSPENQSPPIVTGNAVVGSTLSTTNGTWVMTGSEAPFPVLGYTYQWQDCDATGLNCSNIPGATSSTYTVQASDAGRTIRSVVTATNEGGFTAQASNGPPPSTTSTTSSTSTTTSTTTTTTTTGGGGPSLPVVGAASTTCNKYASPSGSDSNAGTLASPYATLGKLDSSLSAGQHGCLRAGTYGGTSSSVSLSNGAGVTITGYPGEAATIDGFVDITGAGTDLSYLNFDENNTGNTTTHCNIHSPSAFSMRDDANNLTLEHSNLYQSDLPQGLRAVGIGVGWGDNLTGGTIRYNRIHDFGTCPVEDHGIYLNGISGAQIYGNWIYNEQAGTGMQLYASSLPGPSNAHIYANVIDNTSSCFDLGGNDTSTAGNLLEHNLCTNMTGVQPPTSGYCNRAGTPGSGYGQTFCTGPDPGVTLFDFWSGGTGNGNVLQNNLSFCSATATHCTATISGTSGVTLSGNIATDPKFSDPNYQTSHNYTVSAASPAASWGLWNGVQ